MIRSAFALALLFATPTLAQPGDFSNVEITVSKVAEGIYMIEGAGGNIGLSVGPDGAFVVDDQFAPLSEKIRAAIAKETDKPVDFLLNTHWHGDHTGGNEAFAMLGAHIVAQDNVRKRLKEGLTRASGETTTPAPARALPIITFENQIRFYWNGDEIDAFHPGPAHTDGDAIVFFRKANVIHAGDVFFNGHYPYIDLESGGDLDGYIAAEERMLSLADDETRIIPGHGALGTKADLQRSIDMLKKVRLRVQALIDAGKSEDETVAARPLVDLDPAWSWSFISGEKMTRTAYRSLKQAEARK
ncbi:MAG: MBL fold metallo-hydrolase [Alphaproteobacteria bacterium]|nr:MBL fold metallo-hydrolase [Alphaproteobacteria bacterium]